MEETIIFNECFNGDGRQVYLYRSRETGLWTAYGYSAYKAAGMARESGLRVAEGFSERVQMPVAVLDGEAFKLLASLCRSGEQTPDSIRLPLPDPVAVDEEGYSDWAQSLREIANTLTI